MSQQVAPYRHHKPTGQAVVTLNGKDCYLGKWNSAQSRGEYNRLVGEWMAGGRMLPTDSADGGFGIAELCVRDWRFAQEYYVEDGKQTGEVHVVKNALGILKKYYGRTLAKDFGPLSLEAVQLRLVNEGYSRPTINHYVGRIRRVFRWGVAKELVPPSVLYGLQAVPGLRSGRTTARDTVPVGPVDDAVVDATLPHLPPIVADMVRLQRLTGCRPGEVCALRPCDVDTSNEIWVYKPASHKTQHHGRGRSVLIGPRAQDVLRKYLLRPADACCFSPSESEEKRRAIRHEQRITPASCGNTIGTNAKKNPQHPSGDRYNAKIYGTAITRTVSRLNKTRPQNDQLQAHKAEVLKRLRTPEPVCEAVAADVTPPDAITGILTAFFISAIASKLGPAIITSLAMSV